MRIVLAIATIAIASAWAGGQEIEVGKPFPTVALPSLEDRAPTSITSYRGQKVFLHVFASW
jgi:hypothetical protein